MHNQRVIIAERALIKATCDPVDCPIFGEQIDIIAGLTSAIPAAEHRLTSDRKLAHFGQSIYSKISRVFAFWFFWISHS
jgi:hypothetical protein